jgi:formylglycine-generating enzyme required for sulfatase activity
MIMQLMTPDIPDRPAETGRSGKWWIATLVSLWVLFAVCVLIFIVMAHDGLAAVVLIVICSFAAAPVCLVLATISFVKREKHSVWTSIVALPCLALLAWELFVGTGRLCKGLLSAHDDKVYNDSLDRLKADPEIALREHWFTNPNTPKWRAFYVAVVHQEVQFSASQVEQIYAEVPSFRELVFKQATCTPEFISAHFQEAFDLARKNSPEMLVNIIDNPHTPVQLVQRVVFFRKQLPGEPPSRAIYEAGQVLWSHKSDMPVFQSYLRGAEGKFFVLTLDGNHFLTLAGGRSRWFQGDGMNSYVPGVPADFDLMQLGPDKLVFLPGVYSEESTGLHTQQLHLAEAFALEHNQQVFRQKSGQPASNAPAAQLAAGTQGKNRTTTLPNGVTLDLIWITPGIFTMGSPRSEIDSEDYERPQRLVLISKEFWLGKTVVTQGQYRAIMGKHLSSFAKVGADAPVEQVSWDESMEFCRKLTEQERAAGRLPVGYAYTLPTEAQWEYACRAGTTEARYGNLDDIAWYSGNSGDTTHPVAQKQPNAFGLYDMIGNVYEWCSDWYGDYQDGDVTDPAGPPSGHDRVIRGGCFGHPAVNCRSAVRRWNEPGQRFGSLGFRVALSFVGLDKAGASAKLTGVAARGSNPPASSVVQPAVTATSTQVEAGTPGKNRTVTLPKTVTMDLMRIAPGTFTMGDPCSEDI